MSFDKLKGPLKGSELDCDLIGAIRSRAELAAGMVSSLYFLEIELGYEGAVRREEYRSFQPYIDEILEAETPVTSLIKDGGGRCWIDYSDVKQGKAQAQFNWHVDGFGGLIMCDALPTEYLAGETPSDPCIAEWVDSFKIRPQSKVNPADLDIVNSGLSISAIEPHVSFDLSPEVIHRPVVNMISPVVERTFVALIPYKRYNTSA